MVQNRRESGKIAVKYVIDKLEQLKYIVNTDNINSRLSVNSPSGKRFKLRVTSLSTSNAWIIPDPDSEDSYYVLVYKPLDKSPAFFVLNSCEMKNEKQKHYKSMRQPINEYNNPDLEKRGLSFKQPFSYENKWDSLPN